MVNSISKLFYSLFSTKLKGTQIILAWRFMGSLQGCGALFNLAVKKFLYTSE